MEEANPRPAVLIVESDPATSDLYVRELGHLFAVLSCASAAEALQVLARQPLQAVVLEPVGLGPQGWDVLTTVRNGPPDDQPPVVVCSTLDDRKTGLDRGAAVYLVKPVLPAALISVLQSLRGGVSQPMPQ